MPTKTKAQLQKELTAAKEANKNLSLTNDEQALQLQEMKKTNAELGVRIGQLESELAELSAFKQDSLKAMERQSKQIEFMKTAADSRKAQIKQQADFIRELEKGKETVMYDLSVREKTLCDLMTSSVWNFIKARRDWKKGGEA